LGRLATAFNDMVANVAPRRAALISLNQTLESRVAGRTETLRESEERFRKAARKAPPVPRAGTARACEMGVFPEKLLKMDAVTGGASYLL
jgi:hypothetical protein